jgi:hypothetical protein
MWLLLSLGCSDYAVTSKDHAEVFVQPEDGPAADVLFVVDDSASMSEEQALLGANFAAFVDVLAGTEGDWRIGVVTTDTSGADAGRLRGAILTPDTPDLVAAFEAAVTVGTSGSRDEQGLWAAALATEPGRNPDFVRADARLDVVFVSDEDDHSAQTVPTYLGILESYAGAGGVEAHALVGSLPAGCVSGTSAADPGTRYLEAASESGGWSDSICADDYTPLLTRIGLDVGGWNDTFFLEHVPAPETLVVSVDGVAIHERDEDGWRYDAGDNAIVFTGRAIPRPGMTVLVEYTPWVGAAE